MKAKQTLSKRKIMTTVFWDCHGVLLVDFMPQKEQRSTQVQLYGSSEEHHYKANGAASCQKEFYSSTITQSITHLE
ncbi:hypothetical protein TNCV_1013901 [Trichonephila clavipes]|uniref:Uncharacterized protein n=1 Tax=Trichonephila clavipes TaxID=2585209 RepID=A0A8X6VXU9_TRICX|nr:hypothetical protein TNCV_1013901 [Trichonephila clavipes]